MNRFPLWKNILVVLALLVAGLYAVPNLFDQDPSIEISLTKHGESDGAGEDTPQKIRTVLEPAGLAPKAIEFSSKDKAHTLHHCPGSPAGRCVTRTGGRHPDDESWS